MAGEAFNMLTAMGLGVAAGALGHELRVIFPERIIGVKDLVTVFAVETVLATLVFKILEMGGMATGAFSNGERLGSDVVEVGRYSLGLRSRRNFRRRRNRLLHRHRFYPYRSAGAGPQNHP